MAQLHSIPNWFAGFNIFFEILFLIATALVAFYAFKIYKLSRHNETKLFGISFASLSISYLVLAVVNIFFLSASENNTFALTIRRIIDVKNTAIGLYIVFFIIGFVTLLYTTLKTNRLRIYGILLILTFTAINFSFDKVFMIYFISSLFLLFINYHYFVEYRKKKNTNIFLVLIGMFFLFLSNVIFLPQIIYIPTYVISHSLELIGYSFIVASLVKVIQNGKKKKQIRGNKRHP